MNQLFSSMKFCSMKEMGKNNKILSFSILCFHWHDTCCFLFPRLLLYLIDSYDTTTGTFTVPPGGDGYYYFSTYLLGFYSEFGVFDLQINEDVLCSVRLEQHQAFNDFLQSACSAATYAVQGTLGFYEWETKKWVQYLLVFHWLLQLLIIFISGDLVQVVLRVGDTTPLGVSSGFYYNGFTGFRIWVKAEITRTVNFMFSICSKKNKYEYISNRIRYSDLIYEEKRDKLKAHS